MAKMKEMTKVRLIVAGVVALSVVLAALVYPVWLNRGIDAVNNTLKVSIPKVYNLQFSLGLDLQGGTQLVYQADVSNVGSDQGAAMEGVRDVIERRVNAFGVSEPVVQTNQAGGQWRVIVELAGIKDVQSAIKMIGETPLLEFKEKNEAPARDMTADEIKQLNEYNKSAEVKAADLLKKAFDGADFTSLVKENSDDVKTKAGGGDLGWISIEKNPNFETLIEVVAKNTPKESQVINKVVKTDDGYNIVKYMGERDGEAQVKASHILICYKGASGCSQETSKEDAKKQAEDLLPQLTTKNFAAKAKEFSTEPGADTSGGDLGYFSRGMMVKEFEDQSFSMKVGEISPVIETQFGFHIIYKVDEEVVKEYQISRLFVRTKTAKDFLPPTEPFVMTGLSGKHLKKAVVEFDNNTSRPMVGLEFNEEGTKLFGDITSRNVGKQVAIYLDGKAISSPVVNEAITDGKAVIQGDFNITEAKLLVQRLNAGALPVPVTLISQQTLGASLGQVSLQKSLMAGLIGFLVVVLFMILYYRLPGLLASLALVVYTCIVLFIFKIVPVTLTLSGIAGFILSLGIAVDANVLIFERLKEELKAGKPLGSAIDEGFKRAWPSIRDGNVSTLITCFILAWFGASLIKGFAITLIIGILVSLFSAIVITRYFMKMAISGRRLENHHWLFGVRQKKEETIK